MKRIIRVFGLLLLLCLFATEVEAANRYVSKSGSDSNTGASWAQAWRTIQKVNSSVVGGDSVFFGTGVWNDTTLYVIAGSTGFSTVYACSALAPTNNAGQYHFARIHGGTTITGWTQVGVSNVWIANYTPKRTNPPLYQGRNNLILRVADSASVNSAGKYWNGNGRFVVWLHGNANPNSVEVVAGERYNVELQRSGVRQNYVKLIGLSFEYSFAKGITALDGQQPDYISIERCFFNQVAASGGTNVAHINFMANGGVDDGSDFISVLACSLGYSWTWGGADDAAVQTLNYNNSSAMSVYQMRYSVIDSCTFFGGYSSNGTLMFKAGYGDGATAWCEQDTVRNCIFNSSSNSGVWIYNHVRNIVVSGNYFNGPRIGVLFDYGTAGGWTDLPGNNKIWNNTFIANNQWAASSYPWYRAYGESHGYSHPQYGNSIKYNIFYSTLATTYAVLDSVSFYTPADIDSNLFYATGTIQFQSPFGTNRTQSVWQSTLGFDVRSTFGVNPNFASIATGDYSRPSSDQEMNRVYGGKTWTRYGAWQPGGAAHSEMWHDIGQTWHDNYGGLVNAANGFAAGDTLNLIENIYCRNKKWGFIIQTPVVILGNGYKIAPDSVALNTIANNSFETPDSDPTRALNWDFADAPAITRRFGHYEVVTEGSDEPSLWDGSYALRVQLPCATQTVKSSATYNFAPKTHHAIEMAYLNTASNNVRITVGLLNVNGDTAYSAMNNVGTMERGAEPAWVHFMTTDTVETYRIFVQITGGDAAATSDQVFFDHVLHTTFRTFGIALEPDTCSLVTDRMNSQRYYVPSGDSMAVEGGTCYGSAASNREFWGIGVAGGTGEGTIIRDLRIEPVQPTLLGWGIYGSYTCSDVTIKNAEIFPKGSNPHGVFTWNGVRWIVDSTDITFPTDPRSFHYSSRESVPSVGINFRADKNNHGYGSRASYCRMYNIPYQGVYTRTRRDTSADGIMQFPLNIVEYCEFYPKTLQSNGFAIEDAGGAPSILRFNKIDGTGQYHGTGIHITGKTADPDSMQWSIVEGNVAAVESYPYSQEYGYGNLAYGIQLEGVSICSMRTNYATAIAIDPSAPAVDGIRVTRSGSFKWFIHDNTFRGFSTGTVTGSALQLYYPNWSYEKGVDFIEMRHNSFITNGLWLRGVGVNSAGLEFKDNFFDYKDTLTAPNWRKAKSGENSYLSARDLRFIDNRYGDAEADSAFEQRQMFGSYNSLTTANDGTEWFVSWTATIFSRDESLTPLSGTLVEIHNAQDSLIYSGVTGVSGQLVTIIDEFRDSAKTTTYNQLSDRIIYNPHTITVTHNAVEQQQQFTIGQPTTLNFTFTLGEAQAANKKRKLILE